MGKCPKYSGGKRAEHQDPIFVLKYTTCGYLGSDLADVIYPSALNKNKQKSGKNKHIPHLIKCKLQYILKHPHFVLPSKPQHTLRHETVQNFLDTMKCCIPQRQNHNVCKNVNKYKK